MEVTRQEAPTAPESFQSRLREFDPRLRVVFNTGKRLWQVQEQIRDGTWTHVLFWHDGPWSAPEFRQLPFSPDALIVQIQKRDIESHGGNLPEYAKRLDSIGAGQRAERLRDNGEKMRHKFREYVGFLKSRMDTLQRRFAMGGKSREDAIKERDSFMRQLREGN